MDNTVIENLLKNGKSTLQIVQSVANIYPEDWYPRIQDGLGIIFAGYVEGYRVTFHESRVSGVDIVYTCNCATFCQRYEDRQIRLGCTHCLPIWQAAFKAYEESQ